MLRKSQKGHHLEDPGVNERIMLKWILEKWDEVVDWIEVAQLVEAPCCYPEGREFDS